MNLDEKFSPLFNQLSGSIKIRQRIAYPSPEPTIAMAHQDLFKRSKAQNMYVERLYESMTDRTVNGSLDHFDNSTVSAHWVDGYLDESLKGLNLLPEKVLKHMEKIKLFAEAHSVDIQVNLNNIESILKEYENDPKIQQAKDLIIKKKEVIAEWSKVISECTVLLEKTGKSKFNNKIDENIDLSKLKTFIDEKSSIFDGNSTNKEPNWFNYALVEKYIDRLNHENIEAFLKIRATGVPLTMADNFIRDKHNMTSSKNIAEFLKDKIDEKSDYEQGVKNRIEFNNFRTKEIIIFVDDSMLGRKSDGTYFDIFTKEQLHKVKDSIISEHVRNVFNKNPTVAKNFIDIFKKDNSTISIKKLLTNVNTYSTNIEFFNNKPFDVKVEYEQSYLAHKKDHYRAYEDLDDKMHKKMKAHKVQQFAHSIASNKYKDLYNDESYKIIESIYDLKLKSDIFQDYIGKKIAAYKTPEQFNEGLSSFLKSFNGFDMQSMLVKAENAGARIISEADDTLIIEIDDYQQSKLLGSSSWCIVRDESYFNSYTEDGNKQYFLYDFSLDSADNASMIGFTLDRHGDHYAAHYKDDDEINQDEETLSYARDIINELNYKETINRTARMSI